MLKNKVKRYWIKDLPYSWKERTAVTKDFDEAIEDICSALSISRSEATSRLLAKGSLESRYKAWIILADPVNPFSHTAKKTPLG